MRHRALPTLVLIPFLAACGDWPDLPETGTARADTGWPDLLPLSAVLPDVGTATAQAETAEDLASRAEGLRRRATLLRTPVEDQEAFEALRARIAG